MFPRPFQSAFIEGLMEGGFFARGEGYGAKILCAGWGYGGAAGGVQQKGARVCSKKRKNACSFWGIVHAFRIFYCRNACSPWGGVHVFALRNRRNTCISCTCLGVFSLGYVHPLSNRARVWRFFCPEYVHPLSDGARVWRFSCPEYVHPQLAMPRGAL